MVAVLSDEMALHAALMRCTSDEVELTPTQTALVEKQLAALQRQRESGVGGGHGGGDQERRRPYRPGAPTTHDDVPAVEYVVNGLKSGLHSPGVGAPLDSGPRFAAGLDAIPVLNSEKPDGEANRCSFAMKLGMADDDGNYSALTVRVR